MRVMVRVVRLLPFVAQLVGLVLVVVGASLLAAWLGFVVAGGGLLLWGVVFEATRPGPGGGV